MSGTTAGALIALVTLGVAFIAISLWRWTKGRHERRLERDIAAGRYSIALKFFLDHGRFVDAGALEEARGNFDSAAEFYERGGELARAGEMYVANNEHGLAALVYRDADMPEESARSFMFDEQYELALPLFESVGAYLKVAECWERLERPEDAAAAYERGAAYGRAATIWMERDETAKAAQLFRRAGENRKAAQAFWRSGDVEQAAQSLRDAREWVTLGRLWAENDETSRAINALGNVEESDTQFRPAWILKAQLEEKLGDAKAALLSHQTLYGYDLEHGVRDDFTRRWILSIAQYHFRNYDYEVGFETLGRLEELGLMTAKLAERVEALTESIAKERGDESRILIESLEVPSSERYEIIDEVGRGGNGVIFRARDRSFRQDSCGEADPSNLAEQSAGHRVVHARGEDSRAA